MEEGSSVNDSPAPPSRPETRSLLLHDLQGKHRMVTAVNRINQEIRFLEEELEKLDTVDAASKVCKELIVGINSKPDALIPVTKGPANSTWDRWFQGSHGSRSHKWWMHK